MSRQDLAKVVQRSISDPAFRKQLASAPANALRGYDLTQDEVQALGTRDAGRLASFGIDQRMSKAFVDPGQGGSTVSVQTTGSEPRDIAPVWIGEGSGESTGVQSPDAADRNLAFASGGSVEPRDTAPVWVGDGSQASHTFSGDDNAGPMQTGYATDEGQLTNDLNSTDSATDIAGGGSIHQE
ncbi:MAG TPA: Os1348 family NHLP clan protein [Candidatus Acidoferrales bacterium]|nr:Os1348 family NHLP clan protein [Candidatus Acidoferrales bacterium]